MTEVENMVHQHLRSMEWLLDEIEDEWEFRGPDQWPDPDRFERLRSEIQALGEHLGAR